MFIETALSGPFFIVLLSLIVFSLLKEAIRYFNVFLKVKKDNPKWAKSNLGDFLSMLQIAAVVAAIEYLLFVKLKHPYNPYILDDAFLRVVLPVVCVSLGIMVIRLFLGVWKDRKAYIVNAKLVNDTSNCSIEDDFVYEFFANGKRKTITKNFLSVENIPKEIICKYNEQTDKIIMGPFVEPFALIIVGIAIVFAFVLIFLLCFAI